MRAGTQAVPKWLEPWEGQVALGFTVVGVGPGGAVAGFALRELSSSTHFLVGLLAQERTQGDKGGVGLECSWQSNIKNGAGLLSRTPQSVRTFPIFKLPFRDSKQYSKIDPLCDST